MANSQWHQVQLFRYFLWQPGYLSFCLNFTNNLPLAITEYADRFHSFHPIPPTKLRGRFRVARTAGCASFCKFLFGHLDSPYHVHPSMYIMMWLGYCSLGTWVSHLLHVLFTSTRMQSKKPYLNLQKLLARQAFLLSFLGFPIQSERDLNCISNFLQKSMVLRFNDTDFFKISA